MKRYHLLFTVLQVPVDLIMILGAFLLAYWLRENNFLAPDFQYIMPLREYLNFILPISCGWIAIFAVTGLYQFRAVINPTALFGRIFASVTLALAVMIVFFFATKSNFFSRLIVGYTWVLATILVFIGRNLLNVFQGFLVQLKLISERIVIIGNGTAVIAISNFYRRHYAQVSIIDKQDLSENQFSKKINPNIVDQVIMVANLPMELNLELINFCERHGIRFSYIPSLIELKSANTIVGTIDEYPIIELKSTPLDGWGRVVKRIVDFIGAAVLLIVLAPVMFIIAILIRLDSPGPALFIQKRNGQFGKTFDFCKFRSMYTHLSTGENYGGKQAEQLRHELKVTQNEASGPLFKVKNDPRVTRLGRFIRKTSLDEIPQLFNVINGEMSLVGPRPALPDEVEQYSKKQLRRLMVKPGLTGLWQVSGRSDASFEDYLKLDMYYIENWSLWLDIQILLKTIWVAIKGKGAY